MPKLKMMKPANMAMYAGTRSDGFSAIHKVDVRIRNPRKAVHRARRFFDLIYPLCRITRIDEPLDSIPPGATLSTDPPLRTTRMIPSAREVECRRFPARKRQSLAGCL